MRNVITMSAGRVHVAGAIAGSMMLGVALAPPASATQVTIDTFPSTNALQPLVADLGLAPAFIGQSIVVPTEAPILTQFSFAFAAEPTPAATGTITVRAVVLPFDPVGQTNTGAPVFVSDPVTVTNPTPSRITFTTGDLALVGSGTYLLGLTTVYDGTQPIANQGQFGTSPVSRYPAGTSWQVTTGIADLNAGKAFADGSAGFGLTFSATFMSGSTGSEAPPDWLQQVGLPASGTCTGIDDTLLNQGGAASGGWGKSWAQWMNGGLGGAVCTRSLAYVGGGRWAVRA
jgi:hypothetical protein